MKQVDSFGIECFNGIHAFQHQTPYIGDCAASAMCNFRIDASGKLRRREGYRKLCDLPEGMRGFCCARDPESEDEAIFYLFEDKLYRVLFSTRSAECIAQFPAIAGSEAVTVFSFGRRIYLLDGKDYYYWGGDSYGRVDGYIPLCYVDVATVNGIGTKKEAHNELTPFARAQYSFDESSRIFLLPEQAREVLWVKVDGVPATYQLDIGFTDHSRLQVNLDVLARPGKNTVEICYRLPYTGRREEILRHRTPFLYGGSDDLRVFLYSGDSGQIQYSVSLLQNDLAAEYFPENGYINIGPEPITGIVRRYNHLLIHTKKETFAVQGDNNDRYRVYLVHDRIGNEKIGYAHSIEGDSVTVSGGAVYRMKTTSVEGDRQVVRISDRIATRLEKEDSLSSGLSIVSPSDCEVWYVVRDYIYIYRYDRDVWYRFNNPGVEAFFSTAQNRIGFLRKNALYLYEPDCETDEGGQLIVAFWESAPFSFSKRAPICEVAMRASNESGEGVIGLDLISCEDGALSDQTVIWEEKEITFPIGKRGEWNPTAYQKVRMHTGKSYAACLFAYDPVTVSFFGIRQRDGKWEGKA